MKFGSVCSGIEAASVAWHTLGWRAAWFSEIEPFPCAVLAHHYPNVPNLGDMTSLPERILLGEVEAPNVFCGGTPCQAFSVAGLRKSLDDARGNLSLVFCEIANAIDTVRSSRDEPPAIIFWENVPGVLSTADNAFGCFLAGLAGEDQPLEPPGGRWANAGYVLGPKRAAAWRVLDAQYFGLAQRRRRVFVVASARNDFDPAEVLFEFDGVRRDSAPRREAREATAGGAGAGAQGGGAAVGVCPTLRAGGNRTGGDRPPGTDVDTADSLIITMAHDQGGAEIARDRSPTLTCNHEAPIAVYTGQASTFQECEFGVAQYDVAGTLRAGRIPEHQMVLEPVAFQPVADCLTAAYGTKWNGNASATNGSLFAFHPTQDPISRADGTTHAMGCGSSSGQASVAVAYTTKLHNTSSNQAGKFYAEYSTSLDANSPPPAVVFQERGRDGGRSLEIGGEVAFALTAPAGGGRAQERNVLTPSMQVRRLTPVECERLQGFPDNFTAIPWRKKPADQCPDGPRYKALGNSWAVPVVRWIGKRIAAHVIQKTNA